MNPFEAALEAYHLGYRDAYFAVGRDDGFQQRVPVAVFFEDGSWPKIEEQALRLCRGDVLDVGAAVGRHSLALQQRGLNVWSLDILPQAVRIMAERGVLHPMIGNILEWEERTFDTILMLMNGIGLVGTPEGLDSFLQHAHLLVTPGGQILCDSIDVSVTTNPIHVAYREENERQGLYPGQQRFKITYDNLPGESFTWLHIDFASLARHCSKAGWNCALISEEADGHYLAEITMSKDRNS